MTLGKSDGELRAMLHNLMLSHLMTYSGHAAGAKDNELYARWVQLGVWSPILRLHNNENLWSTKEPWEFSASTNMIVSNALRYRHRLIPYLYTMNYISATTGIPIVRPLYYEHSSTNPTEDGFYTYKQEFFFGSELFVIPISAETERSSLCSQVLAWFPPGEWIDIATGVTYTGGREMLLHRTLEQYPVFARPGSIVPLDGASELENGAENPQNLEVLLVIGADGVFHLHEDDGMGQTVDDVQAQTTVITYDQQNGQLTINDGSSTKRTWRVRLLGYNGGLPDGARNTTEITPSGMLVTLAATADRVYTLSLGPNPLRIRVDPGPAIQELIARAQIAYEAKTKLWTAVRSATMATAVTGIMAVPLNGYIQAAIIELLLADARVAV